MEPKRQPVFALFQLVARPIVVFFKLEAASAVLLFAAAVLALIWANSPWGPLYRELLGAKLTVGASGALAHFDVHALVNDGLMTVFFFVVGMEIKRELAMGELKSVSRATLPAVAALGGMLMPAAIYFALNRGGPGEAGWGVPMATDIAFSIGVLTLLKGRVPHALVVFLTALAIFDDIGGIIVIALFYGTGLKLEWLLASAAVAAVLLGFNRLYVRNGALWGLGLAALWYAMHHSGVHATISGVVTGLLIPARPPRDMRGVLEELHGYTGALVAKPRDEELDAAEVLAIEEKLENIEAPLDRFVHVLHPYVAFGIMPVFALANSGVDLSGIRLADLAMPIPLGTALGLFLGKQLGIFGFTYAAVRLGFAPMPGGGSPLQLYGVATVAGIGFTVALFIASLAFPTDAQLLDQAKLGILLGSLASGLVGYAVLRLMSPPATAPQPVRLADGARP